MTKSSEMFEHLNITRKILDLSFDFFRRLKSTEISIKEFLFLQLMKVQFYMSRKLFEFSFDVNLN